MKSYNTIDEAREYFTGLGFHEYEPTRFDAENIITCFQKRYDDELGKKYFIDARLWDFSWSDKVPENYHPELCMQVYQKDTHDAVNFTYIDWDVDQVEKFIDRMFELGLLEHYELWD